VRAARKDPDFGAPIERRPPDLPGVVTGFVGKSRFPGEGPKAPVADLSGAQFRPLSLAADELAVTLAVKLIFPTGSGQRF